MENTELTKITIEGRVIYPFVSKSQIRQYQITLQTTRLMQRQEWVNANTS